MINLFAAPPLLLLRPLVEAALREDIRSGDATTMALIPVETSARALMKTREDGIWCGADVARLAWSMLDETLQIEVLKSDGESMRKGEALMRIEGPARAILTGERVALNFAQRMSGVATLTNRFVQAVASAAEKNAAKANADETPRIADTRKTTPGLRVLEKYAVRCGGGTNHRYALDDLILIKDNHIAVCGGIEQAVERARAFAGHAMKIEVECDTLRQAEEAVKARADIILLDNMSTRELRQAVAIIGGRATSEASGGVNLETVGAIAQTGVDIISVGALTHGARALDLGLDLEIEA